MRKNWKQYIGAVLIGVAGTSGLISCNKWIDVTPQTQIRDDIFFSKQSGFVNAINGVYLSMGDPSLYGREMSFGIVDVIGQMYTLRSTFGLQVYIDAQNYLYNQANVQAITEPIWQNTYNAIANLNSVIENFEKVDSTIFTPGNYAILKGEALGLRAFIHFDLARLYAPSYLSAKSAPAIPYVTEFRPKVVPKSSVEVVMQRVLTDLLQADSLLVNDPIGIPGITAATLNERKLKMNRYAVKATLARVYLWMGDKVNALKYAEQVIAVSGQAFPWIARGVVATSTEEARNRIFSTELIFNLQVTNIAANIKATSFQLDTAAGAGGGRSTAIAIVDYTRIYDQYETNATNGGVGGTDLRWLYLIRKYTTATTPISASFYGKLYQYSSMPAESARRQPMIRISEMYYIAAECLAETNLPKAIDYLNLVRVNRNLAALSSSTSKDLLDGEILKEYRKEFPAEGQLFFYYKRLDKSVVPGATQPFNKQNYVLPLPLKELEFGS